MKTSENGIKLIQKFEGLKNNAYLCPAKVWTIGYGHTAGVKKGDTCTKEQAVEFLKQDLEKFEAGIEKLVKIELTQNQFDALVSFVFNIGLGAFSNSTMLKFLNQGHIPLAAGQFDRWVKVQNIVLEGLVNRRKAEKELFLKQN